MDNKKKDLPNPMQFRIFDAKNHRNTALLQACPIANGRAMGMVQRANKTQEALGKSTNASKGYPATPKNIHDQNLGDVNHAQKGEERNRR